MSVFDLHPQMLLRLVIAMALGALVGYEREREGKPAGVQTHGMVCLGAALFTVVSIYGLSPTTDTARVAAMVVSGIGFLGAGAILRQRENVHGLTTAASLSRHRRSRPGGRCGYDRHVGGDDHSCFPVAAPWATPRAQIDSPGDGMISTPEE